MVAGEHSTGRRGVGASGLVRTAGP